MKKLRIEDKLYLVGYNVDHEYSHLGISDPEVCKTCEKKQCTYVCPASVYTWDEAEQKININYDACVECGTCMISCDYITWKFPRGGFGVAYKFG
ncbi:ferredoxin family protein [Hippea maritima]|uniref:Ferredoxin-like protein n=1 Tax=Hippea maritima (strain ATCC 700847 / DSM 10411 / MH2) TaxID=760142 RepID=F2LXB5_HIPMA|nr:4Fe-4S dicluster domain-containing protein [Hippea maritima]AEA34229.1 ferredoxin [Hippea maritima DSM 10411]